MIAAAAPWAVAFFAVVVGLHVLQAGAGSVLVQSGLTRALAVFARERRNPFAALCADVVVAVASPFTPGPMHAVVDAYVQHKLEARAIRTMALSAMLQAPTWLFLAFLAIREGGRAIAAFAVIAIVTVAWAAVWSRTAPKDSFVDDVYVQHRGPVDWLEALSHGWSETADVLKHNNVRIVGLALWGAWLVVNRLTIQELPIGDLVWIAFIVFIAAAFRIDPILILPVGIGRYTDGSSPEGLVSMFVVAAACGTATQVVLDERLHSGAAETWGRALRFTYAPLVAIAFIALNAVR